MSDRRGGYRHGVHKKLAEGIGGVLVGAALVLLVRGLLRKRQPAKSATDETDTLTTSAAAQPDPR